MLHVLVFLASLGAVRSGRCVDGEPTFIGYEYMTRGGYNYHKESLNSGLLRSLGQVGDSSTSRETRRFWHGGGG